ncbi:MAG: hypothetical protein J6X89_06315 [Bacteroidales bacterium]|nr:hypothetical protein [Bacteroidales bacterium]
MCEEKKEFDPRDRNQDGKVSVKEIMQDAVDKVDAAFTKAGDAIRDQAGDVIDKVKQGADNVVGKVKGYADMTPEERKAKNQEFLDKASGVADKIADATKEVYEDVKEGAEKLFSKKQ